MTSHILSMTQHSTTSSSLTSTSLSDHTKSSSLHQQSITSQTEAEELKQTANSLQAEAAKHELESKQDTQKASGHFKTSQSEQDELTSLEAKIATEEAAYEGEIEKATEEASLAAENVANTESDGVATSFCEFIPFVDVICDFIGGLSAVGFQLNASELSAESALDYGTAAAMKDAEDVDISEMDVLETEIGQEEELAESYQSKAEKEGAEAKEEEVEAKEDLMEAEEEEGVANEEEAQSKEEGARSEQEEEEAEEEMEKAFQEGINALEDAVYAGLCSTLAVAFFAFRTVIAFIVPGTIAVLTVIPYAYSMAVNTSSQAAAAAAAATQAASSTSTVRMMSSSPIISTAPKSSSVFLHFIRHLWMALPRRETSYFLLHCGIFISTMSIWFTPKFQRFDDYTIKSRGGIIILFALLASLIQGLLLHAIPHFVMRVMRAMERNNQEEEDDVTLATEVSYEISAKTATRPESTSITFYQVLTHMGSSILKLITAILHLTPLYLMEVMALWLIFGPIVVTFQLPNPLTPTNLGVGMLLTCIFYILVFEITMQMEEEEEEATRTTTRYGTCLNSNGDLYVVEEEEEERTVPNKNNSNINGQPRQSSSSSAISFASIPASLNSAVSSLFVGYNRKSNTGDDDGIAINETRSLLEEHNHYNTYSNNCNDNNSEEQNMDSESLSSSYDNKSNNVNMIHHVTKENIICSVQDDSDLESIALTASQQCTSSVGAGNSIISGLTQRSNPPQSTYYRTDITIDSEDVTALVEEVTTFGYVIAVVEQYVTDLKLPFEILIMTCMFILLRGCIPILVKLLPKVIEGHQFFFLWVGLVVIAIGVILWYLLRKNNHHGHVRLWTGDALRY